MSIERDKFYRTREGKKCEVVALNGHANYPVIGIVEFGSQRDVAVFTKEGKYNRFTESPIDLIAPWIEKPEVDWSVLPAWHNSVVRTSTGSWYSGVNLRFYGGGWAVGDIMMLEIPEAYAPKFTGDWKDSLVTREVAK